MPTLSQVVKEQEDSISQYQRNKDREMSAIFWYVPYRGGYEDSPAFYEAIKTPEKTLETLNEMRQISSEEFRNHWSIYLRGANASISWHEWKTNQISELIYAGTWFLMFKDILNNPKYTLQLRELLKVIKNKVDPLVPQASVDMQKHWKVMLGYWEKKSANKKLEQTKKPRRGYSSSR